MRTLKVIIITIVHEGMKNHITTVHEAKKRRSGRKSRDKRGPYVKLSSSQRCEIAKYADQHGAVETARHFSRKLGKHHEVYKEGFIDFTMHALAHVFPEHPWKMPCCLISVLDRLLCLIFVAAWAPAYGFFPTHFTDSSFLTVKFTKWPNFSLYSQNVWK